MDPLIKSQLLCQLSYAPAGAGYRKAPSLSYVQNLLQIAFPMSYVQNLLQIAFTMLPSGLPGMVGA